MHESSGLSFTHLMSFSWQILQSSHTNTSRKHSRNSWWRYWTTWLFWNFHSLKWKYNTEHYSVLLRRMKNVRTITLICFTRWYKLTVIKDPWIHIQCNSIYSSFPWLIYLDNCFFSVYKIFEHVIMSGKNHAIQNRSMVCITAFSK